MILYNVITIVDRSSLPTLHGICEELKLPVVLTNLGQGTATDEHLSLHNLSATEKAIVSTVADGELLKKITRQAKQKMFIDIPGNGIMMAIPLKSVCGQKTLAYITNGMTAGEGGKPEMQFEHELIIVVLNEGYSDDIMEAARSAGATGGTVLHAKGTLKESDAKFHGLSLAEEKDMIYIVASSEKKAAIMRAINECSAKNKEFGAFCFSLPISEVSGLRKFDEE
ncbi:MAG: P-II family nitrogen regulator [Clostridia bacterium]|nr:P-II family nitrogen regulator [Clostridia bacterium]